MPTQIRSTLIRWLPALFVMATIFAFSSFPSYELPSFDLWDRVVKKGGHMLGYGLLAWSYAHALRLEGKRLWIAWPLAVLYALTDEYHQSFVPGRNASVWDVIIFDGGGALIALWLASRYRPGANPDRR